MAAAIHCVILGSKSRRASPHVGTLPTFRKGLDLDTVTSYSSLSLFPILLFLETPSDFINVGVEQTLKVIQDFFLWLFFFPPQRKTFCVTSIKFGTKPLARAVVSEK